MYWIAAFESKCNEFEADNIIYKIILPFQLLPSLRSNMLQLLIAPKKIVGVCFRHNLSFVWFLHEILITLLLGEADGIFLTLEIDVCALHEIC